MAEAPQQAQTESPPEVEVDFMALDDLIFKESGGDKENLIMILQAINKQYKYLPLPALKFVSAKLGVPLSRLYEIATFYSMFSLEPRGENIISICLGTACHVRGAEPIKQALEEHLGLKAGETSKDLKFTIDTVRCIGCCSLGPVVTINDETFGRTSSDEMINVVDKY